MENEHWDSESGSEIDYEVDNGIVIEQDDQVWDETQLEGVKQIDEETHRLALVNFDYQFIKAKDIYMLVSSFKGQESTIRNVQVYMSDFGKERIEKEEREGPANIWKENEQIEEDEENEEHEDKRYQKQKNRVKMGREKNNDLWTFKREEETGIDMFKLRKYELERLKYYYCVIICDNKQTAAKVYENMDGFEFEQTGLKVDLRFIPDETEFNKANLVEECNQVSANYNKKDWINRALSQTNVRLTWDQPNYERFNFHNN